jgi:hypothetical protein
MSLGMRSAAVVVMALLASGQGRARAQFGFIGPGSTPQGDIMRGEGILYSGLGNFYNGLGMFNLNSAMAESINVDTSMRLNEYIYQSRLEQIRRLNERVKARKENHLKQLAEIRKRLSESPNESDLMNGDALNILLEQLTDPRIPPSTLRYARVPLPGETIQMIPFQYATMGGVISMRQLTVRDGWPLALRGEDFALERRIYLRAVDRVLEEDLDGKLSLPAVNALQQAILGLQNKMEEKVPESDLEIYLQAKNFIKSLSESTRMLKSSVVERVLADIQKYPGTTVADLLEFMQRYNLQFSPATVPAERDLYRALYQLLVRQRTVLAMQGAAKAGEDPGAPINPGAPAGGAPRGDGLTPGDVSGTPNGAQAQKVPSSTGP